MLFGLSLATYGQDEQQEYLKGKELYQSGDYAFAMKAFEKVFKSDGGLSDYAYFHYALCAYETGQLGLARSILLQMERGNEQWHEMSDVYYWLSKVYFDEGDYNKGIEYSKKSRLKEALGLMSDRLGKVDSIPLLESIYLSSPENSIVGKVLAKKIAKQPIERRNIQLLNSIVHKFGLDGAQYGLPDIGQSQLKSTYRVAVLMPFMFQGLNQATRTAKNKFVMDIYMGIQKAAAKINTDGKKIELYPFDTKRSKTETEQILAKEEMKGMDLIIGPLFPEPSALAVKFSYDNQINLINPLSTSSELIRFNPYAFLLRPTIETQSRVTARLVAEKLENKNAMIFYENNAKDSLSAATYAIELQARGFNVVANLGVVDSTVRGAFNMLTEKFEIEYTKEEVDSVIAVEPERKFETRKSTKQKNVTEYYEEFFKIKPDSIGHIFVASSKPLFASTFIGAVEIRYDSTLIIGRQAWRDFESITYEELERLGVWLIAPDHVDLDAGMYREFQEEVVKEYKVLPSFNTLLGFELMHFTGSMMLKYGNYFQNGLAGENTVKGYFFEGLNYTFANSNQYVPITRFEESIPKVVNPIEDESDR